jgi:DNA-binding transcriptional MerR regulator
MLKIQAFAKRGGVSIRTLRHYDHLGLLKPSARSKSGYRLYEESDVKKLEQIIALRAFGLSLTDIGRALGQKSGRSQTPGLTDALQRQKRVLLEQRRVATDALDAIGFAERAIAQQQEPDWKHLAMFVKTGGDASRLEQARRQIMERRRQWTPVAEDIAVMRDIKAAIDREETRESPAWRMLVDRLKEAIDRFTGGDPELRSAVALVMADQVNWPGPEIGAKFREFFTEAISASAIVH